MWGFFPIFDGRSPGPHGYGLRTSIMLKKKKFEKCVFVLEDKDMKFSER